MSWQQTTLLRSIHVRTSAFLCHLTPQILGGSEPGCGERSGDPSENTEGTDRTSGPVLSLVLTR